MLRDASRHNRVRYEALSRFSLAAEALISISLVHGRPRWSCHAFHVFPRTGSTFFRQAANVVCGFGCGVAPSGCLYCIICGIIAT